MAKQAKIQPEAKFVYQGGVGVAVWTNNIDTADGPKQVRSLTISPRRLHRRMERRVIISATRKSGIS